MAIPRPRSYVKMAALFADVVYAWGKHHPLYTFKFITLAEMAEQAKLFSKKTSLNIGLNSIRGENTAELRAINKEIQSSVNVLKKYISIEYMGTKDLSGYYAIYGLEVLDTSNRWGLPNRNSARSSAIQSLIDTLSKSGNPFADKEYGLAHWKALQAKHQAQWKKNVNYKMDKTRVSMEMTAYFKNAENLLEKIVHQIKADFPKGERNAVLRTFGFLAENYR